jgi:hypothetical protein
MEAKPNQSKQQGNTAQLLWGLLFGFLFGFLLQRGGATKYDVIIGQLLLEDFTVLKIMLSAVVTGMIGIHLMKTFGWVELHPKVGSFGSSVIGGLIFGAGFAILGYCPGTIAGAVGNGYLDALLGGVIGILIGAGLFASLYPRLQKRILSRGNWGDVTLPRLLRVNDWVVVIPAAIMIIVLLWWIQSSGH